MARERLRNARLFTEDPENYTISTDLSLLYDPKQILSDAEIEKGETEFEKYLIIEQIVIASIELGQFKKAQTHIDLLEKKFTSTSSRVRLLKGLFLEGNNKWDEAIELYKDVLLEDETNSKVQKRLVSCLIGKGSIIDAIATLVEYLDTFINDIEAWSFLSKLYFDQSMYKQAAFCIEECILLNPLNHIYHLKLADIHFKEGKDFKIALQHYLASVELCGKNELAWNGIETVINELLIKEPKNDNYIQLKELALENKNIK